MQFLVKQYQGEIFFWYPLPAFEFLIITIIMAGVVVHHPRIQTHILIVPPRSVYSSSFVFLMNFNTLLDNFISSYSSAFSEDTLRIFEQLLRFSATLIPEERRFVALLPTHLRKTFRCGSWEILERITSLPFFCALYKKHFLVYLKQNTRLRDLWFSKLVIKSMYWTNDIIVYPLHTIIVVSRYHYRY